MDELKKKEGGGETDDHAEDTLSGSRRPQLTNCKLWNGVKLLPTVLSFVWLKRRGTETQPSKPLLSAVAVTTSWLVLKVFSFVLRMKRSE